MDQTKNQKIIFFQSLQIVLIGDHKQLCPIVKCKEAKALSRSMFERLSEHASMLTTQYRMVSVAFCLLLVQSHFIFGLNFQFSTLKYVNFHLRNFTTESLKLQPKRENGEVSLFSDDPLFTFFVAKERSLRNLTVIQNTIWKKLPLW